MIRRELTLLQRSQRELRELREFQLLQHLQMRQNETNRTNPLVPPAAVPQPESAGPAVTGPATNGTSAEQTAQNGQAAPSTANPPPPPPASFPGAAPVFSSPLAAASMPGLPQGLTLPTGWSVIPLTVFGASELDAAARMPPAGSVAALAQRQGLPNYHASPTLTPESPLRDAEARGQSGGWGMSRTASAPPSTSSGVGIGGLYSPIRLTDTSRLTGDQLRVLKPGMAECITALSLWLARYYDQGHAEHVSTVVLGLPDEIRDEILKGWPSAQQVQTIRATLSVLGQTYSGGDILTSAREMAVREVVILLAELERKDRLRVLAPLPAAFRNSVMDRTAESDLLLVDIESLEKTLTAQQGGHVVPNMPEIPPLASDASPAEVSRVDAETRDAVAQRIDALNEAARQMREAARSLEAKANSSSFSVPTPSSFGTSGDERLNLFGERSMFPLPAQERTLRSLESDLELRERESRAQELVEGLLGVREGSGNNQAPEMDSDPELEASSSPSTKEKGKGVDRG